MQDGPCDSGPCLTADGAVDQEVVLARVLAKVMHDRKVYRDALSLGKEVVEMDNPKSHPEMQELTKEIME